MSETPPAQPAPPAAAAPPFAAAHAYPRDPLVWFFVLTAALAMLGFYDMAREVGHPFGGYLSYRRSAASIGEVDANTPGWWSGMIRDRLRHGITLLAADGRPYADARDVFRDAAAAGRQFVAITFLDQTSHQLASRNVPVRPFTPAHFFDARLPDLIMALVFGGLAVVVYLSAPASPVNRAFAAVAALVALVRALFVHSLFLDDWYSIGVELILLTTIPMMGVGLLNFATHFPHAADPRFRWLVRAAAAAAVVVGLAAVVARLDGPSQETLQRAGQINYFGTLILYALGLLALLGRLIRRLARYRQLGRRERRVLIIVLAGLAAALPVLIISALTWVEIDDRRLSYYFRGFDLRYLLLAVPLAFAYVLVRYRALRSPSPLFLVALALSFSALVAALGAWVWAASRPLWPEDGVRPPFLALFVAALLSSLVWGRAASWHGLFGRLFHPDRRAAAAARAFGRHMTAQTDLKLLPEAITRAVVEEFDLERAAIWLRPAEREALELAGRAGDFAGELPLYLSPDAPRAGGAAKPGDAANPGGEPLRLDRPAGLPPWLRPLAAGHGLDVALPLIANDGIIGLVAVGPRWDEEVFDDRDLETAELLGQQATLFLTAAANVAELRRLPGRVADVQDRERQRLAQELHDTIQQFLGRLPFYLAVGRDAAASRPDVTRDILDRAIGEVEEAAIVLRQIRYNLAPSQLERGLVPAVAALCDRFQSRTGIRAVLTADPELDDRATRESRHALYRVIQQALDNVETHAEATAVSIDLAAADGRLIFCVRDDGRGSSEAQRRAAQAAGSFGLQSMRARLEAGGGEFHLQTADGQGTEVGGWLPAA
jgi:signal transduction histidine kinase